MAQVYCDTNLIIDKLCSLAGVVNERETEVMGNAMFSVCASLIPYSMISDAAFLKDRSALTGRSWDRISIEAARPFAISQFKAHLRIITAILKNGKGVVKCGHGVTVADLHLLFVVQWVLHGHHGAEPEVNRDLYPEVYGWVDRVNGELAKKRSGMGKPGKISFEQVKKQLLSRSSVDASQHDTSEESSGLVKGAQVSVTPIDTGKTHPQVGELQFINDAEVCLKTSAGVFVSFPRLNYAIKQVKAEKL